jgi:hypothetical protein
MSAGIDASLTSYNLKHVVERIARKERDYLWVSESTLILAALDCGFRCRIHKAGPVAIQACLNVKKQDVVMLDPSRTPYVS